MIFISISTVGRNYKALDGYKRKLLTIFKPKFQTCDELFKKHYPFLLD